jgi:Holliday junction resolvase
LIKAVNILKSSKHEGRHESVIIKKLVVFFENLGYHAVPHARFNIAWGNILSDVDLLLLKNDEIVAVEVKSSKDNLKRARKQIENIKDYVDYVYVATNYIPRKFSLRNAGLIYVNGSVVILKSSKLLGDSPRLYSLDSLPKKCLCRWAKTQNHIYSQKSKLDLASQIIKDSDEIKSKVKEIVTCGLDCDYGCPIWNFGKNACHAPQFDDTGFKKRITKLNNP